MTKKIIRLWDYRRYPLRGCYTSHECRLCHQDIRIGQKYYDGGYKRRVHLYCAEDDWKQKQEQFQKEHQG